MAIRLDAQTLALFRRQLQNCPTYKLNYKKDARDAAVLMPLCTVGGKASVLFTVRNKQLRAHQDETDPSVEHAALRETMEEVGISPSSIEVLGRYSILPNKTGSLRVSPFVGVIRGDITAESLKVNPEEVSSVFTLPIDYLLRPDVRSIQQFRDSRYSYPVYQLPSHLQDHGEIWGLTSFILDGVLRRLFPSKTT